ncbi:protein gp37 [Bradyrhizobium sp. USDA 4011]
MTDIEWAKNVDGSRGKTWNPVVGCTIKSPGCINCYAMRLAWRLIAMGQDRYKGTVKKVRGRAVWTGKLAQAPEETILEPLRRKKPTTYFVNSMSDLFHEDMPDDWIDLVFAVMALSPQHTFQVLTKRSARMRAYFQRPDLYRRILFFADNTLRAWRPELRRIGIDDPKRSPLKNVWLGVSTERQEEANERIPDLLATPAAVRFISAEPLLGPIDLRQIIREGINGAFVDNALDGFVSNGYGGSYGPKLDWVIVGGESGKESRPMHPDWARALRDQCTTTGVAFFFKQWGTWAPVDWVHARSTGALLRPDGHVCRDRSQLAPSGNYEMARLGKARAGRLLDGITHGEMPRRAA